MSIVYLSVMGVVDLEVDYEAEVSPVVPAYTSGLPEDCYPEEGGDIESCTIHAIRLGTDHDVTGIFSAEFISAVEDALESHILEEVN